MHMASWVSWLVQYPAQKELQHAVTLQVTATQKALQLPWPLLA